MTEAASDIKSIDDAAAGVNAADAAADAAAHAATDTTADAAAAAAPHTIGRGQGACEAGRRRSRQRQWCKAESNSAG